MTAEWHRAAEISRGACRRSTRVTEEVSMGPDRSGAPITMSIDESAP